MHEYSIYLVFKNFNARLVTNEISCKLKHVLLINKYFVHIRNYRHANIIGQCITAFGLAYYKKGIERVGETGND